MKLNALLENEEDVVAHLVWLNSAERRDLIDKGYSVDPVPGYHESNNCRAYRIIGRYDKKYWWRDVSIPIWEWEHFTLTALYARNVLISHDSAIQMFDHLDDDEKIQALKYHWDSAIIKYIKRYFRDHLDLLERARKSLKIKDVYEDFHHLFRRN